MREYSEAQKKNYDVDDTDIMEQDSFFDDEESLSAHHSDLGLDEDDPDDDDELGLFGKEQDYKGGKRKKASAEDDYLAGALPVHKRLPQDPHPTREKLQRIYDDYHSGDKDRCDKAKMDILGIMSPYILNRVSTKYRSYMTRYMDDLMEQGYEGVLKGMISFDPRKGMPTTWFVRYIDHEIQDFISRQIHHSTAYYAQNARVINKCIEDREKKGLDFTVRDLMIETNIPHKTIEKVLQVRNFKNAPIDGEAGTDLASTDETPEDAAIRSEAEETVRGLLSKKGLLTKEERVCVMLRYCISDDDEVVMQKYLELQRSDVSDWTEDDDEDDEDSSSAPILSRSSGKTKSFADVEFLAKKLYDMDIPKYVANRYVTSALTKLKAELGHQKRAKVCHRIRVEIQSHLTGDMISKVAMKKDQEAVAEFFDTEIFTI